MTDHARPTPSASLSYLDFELEIGPGAGREYTLSVVKSPAGEARETMRFPLDQLALDSRLKDLQIALLRSGGTRRQALLPEEQSVQEFGRALMDALLTGEIRSRFDVSRGEARQQGKGLRIKLRILAPELAALPWEFLYDPRQAEFICLSRRTPIVRYLELPQPIQPLRITPPLRILGLIACPCDLPALDVDRERQRLEAAIQPLAARGTIELEWQQGQTWRELQRALRGGPWHILHFAGHGGFNQTSDEGYILLCDETGRSDPVFASELGRILADHDPLRLAVLNSCEGARGGDRDVFSSTASILIRQGLPAVLAMQYAISDRAAVEFSRSFYEAVSDGYPVDASVAEARKAVSMAVENTMEWGTPALFMRSPDGVLFDIQGTPGEPVAPAMVRPAALPAGAAAVPSLADAAPPAARSASQQPPAPPREPAATEGAPPPVVPPAVPRSAEREPLKSYPWSRIGLAVLAVLVVLLLAYNLWPDKSQPSGPATAIPGITTPPSTGTLRPTSVTTSAPEPTATATPTSQPPQPVGAPLVTLFEVVPQTIVAGRVSTIRLTWQTQNADTVVIEPSVGSVDDSGSRALPAPDADTSYTLVARNADGETTATAQLKVIQPICMVYTDRLNLRSGPGTSYPRVALPLTKGDRLEPLAYVASGFPPPAPWVYVRVSQTGALGWVSAGSNYITCNHDVALAPTPATIPPTPTATATSTPTPSSTPTPTFTATPTEPSQVVLAQTSFLLPDDGVPNNNGPIGPFCCTGTTATVKTTGNLPVGYVYFYDWKGQAYNVGGSSIAPDASILVSGISDATNPYSEQRQSSVNFAAAEMQPGVSRSTRAGALLYTVYIKAATIVTQDGVPYFDMGSLIVRVFVEMP